MTLAILDFLSFRLPDGALTYQLLDLLRCSIQPLANDLDTVLSESWTSALNGSGRPTHPIR